MASQENVKTVPREKCPFCGWAGEIETDCQFGPWTVKCPDCFAEGPPELTEAEAIAAWNRRVA